MKTISRNYYSRYLILAGIVFVALGFRIFLFRYRYAVGFDEPHYLQLAASALIHDFKDILHPHWSPLYPIFIAGMSLVIKDFELAGRLVSAISGSLVILPVFFLTRKLFDKTTAYLSAILIALYPPLAFMATDVLTESTYMFLAMSGIAVGWSAVKRQSKLLGLVTGLLFGLSYLTRPEGIGWLIVFLGWGMLVILSNWLRKKQEKLVAIFLFSAIGFLVISSPYLLYLRKETGKWTLSQKWDTARYDIGSLRKLSDDNKFLPADMGWHLGNFHLLELKGKTKD
ncbi:MAG: glycosyltransferase family 39 protein, partial [candidate division KSB1 bacterium]|nr:glycosyltransferase family 39 protein [candidate division KSB1 bacterium]